MCEKSSSLSGHTARHNTSSTRCGLAAAFSLAIAPVAALAPPTTPTDRRDLLVLRFAFLLLMLPMPEYVDKACCESVPAGDATVESAEMGHDTLAYHAQNMSIVIVADPVSALEKRANKERTVTIARNVGRGRARVSVHACTETHVAQSQTRTCVTSYTF